MTAQRDAAWQRLGQRTFDLLVIGAGIIGSRIAYEAARAGLDVALVDAGDFGGATSSGSSKLIHGGFRYLPMGDLGLVWESQRERRALMTHVAPHLVRRLPIVLAAYRGGPTGPALAGAGVLAYGAFCGFRGTGVGLVGAAVDLGVTALNHARITDLAFRAGRPAVASVQGGATEGAIEVACKHVINASGPWVDTVRRLEDPACAPMARLSKGVHLLLEPKTEWRAGVVVPLEHGRVTMAIPWQGMLMLGTTDTDYEGEPGGCAVTESDVAQVLAEASLALPCEVIRPEAVRFSFAGLRVLPMGDGSTAGAHREHLVRTGPRGMVSIAGGKLTTHWRIALDVLHRLADSRLVATRLVDDPLPEAAGGLKNFDREVDPGVALHLARTYGRESFQVMAQQHQHANAMERIHPDGPDVWAQAYHAVEHELAATVDDVVRRRTTLAVRGLASPALKLQIARVIAAVG